MQEHRRMGAFIDLEEVANRLAEQPYDPYCRFAGRFLKKMVSAAIQCVKVKPEARVNLNLKAKTLIIKDPRAAEIA